MLLDPDTENEIAYELCQLLGRAILPISRFDRPGAAAGGFGTAFFWNELIGSTDDGDVVHEYLLTADALTAAPFGEVGVRPSLTEPAGVASDSILLPDFPDLWFHLSEAGVAAMPTGGLHGHAEDRGWQWRTQQVGDAVAARAAEVAGFGAEPSSAFVLALGVADDGSRPLEAVIERVVRDGDELRITTGLPAGYVGAPVFGVQPAGPEEGFALRCLGLVLPGEGSHPIATFDRIRAAVETATAGFR